MSPYRNNDNIEVDEPIVMKVKKVMKAKKEYRTKDYHFYFAKRN